MTRTYCRIKNMKKYHVFEERRVPDPATRIPLFQLVSICGRISTAALTNGEHDLLPWTGEDFPADKFMCKACLAKEAE